MMLISQHALHIILDIANNKWSNSLIYNKGIHVNNLYLRTKMINKKACELSEAVGLFKGKVHVSANGIYFYYLAMNDRSFSLLNADYELL